MSRLVDEDRERRARRVARELRGEPASHVRELANTARVAQGGWPHKYERVSAARERLAGELDDIGLGHLTLAADPSIVVRAVELWDEARRERQTFRRPLQLDQKRGLLVSKGRVLDGNGRRLPLPQAV